MADFDRIVSKQRKNIFDLVEEYKLRLEGFDPYGTRLRDDTTGFMNSGDRVSSYSLEDKKDKEFNFKEEMLKIKKARGQ